AAGAGGGTPGEGGGREAGGPQAPRDSDRGGVRERDTPPPQFVTVPPPAVTVGQEYVYNAHAVDPDGDAVVYGLVGTVPTGLSIDGRTGAVRWTPSAAQAGKHAVTIQAVDALGLAPPQGFTIDRLLPNSPPKVESGPPAL